MSVSMIWVVTQSVLRIPVTVRVLQPEAGPVFSVFPSQTEFSGQPHLPSLLPPLAAAFPGFKIDMHKGEGNTYEEDIRLPTQDINWLGVLSSCSREQRIFGSNRQEVERGQNLETSTPLVPMLTKSL